jgi:diguanylate cyclase (GGDEF)-like protein
MENNSLNRTYPARTEEALDWLLSISALATPAKGAPDPHDRSARLEKMMSALVEHFGCALAALIMPQRHVRLIRPCDRDDASAADDALRALEIIGMDSIRRTKYPFCPIQKLPHGGVPCAYRALVIPVVGNATPTIGVLLLLRSVNDPEFTALHLSVARHLGRQFSSALEVDLDAATGLYTRNGLQQHIESTGASAACNAGLHAVIFINIDHLHAINNVGGFESGDALIARVAQLLTEPTVPAKAAAAHISGGKFAVVLPEATVEVAELTARTLQQLAIRQASDICPQQPVSLSCGIAEFGPASEFQRGLVLAELACQAAKERGRGRLEVYQDNDAAMVRRQTDIVVVQQLRDAMHENRLTLFAQRILPLQGQDELGGYELLLRWVDRPKENKAPGALLGVALRRDLAPELDLWVIKHALHQAKPYLSQLLAANVSLSINLAGPSLTDDSFLERLRKVIRLSALPPTLILFEITETVALLSLTKAVKFIAELRAIGCRFALDDFGTGANSLKNLTNLPVDRVKIDGSFVRDILTNRQSAAIVRAIVTLARDLGMSTVAEYAETPQIAERLRELGVEYAQGYGIEKPRPLAGILSELGLEATKRHPVVITKADPSR